MSDVFSERACLISPKGANDGHKTFQISKSNEKLTYIRPFENKAFKNGDDKNRPTK